MYQVNKKTGDLKQSNRLQHGYTEVNEQDYEKLKQMAIEARVLALSVDGEFGNLQVNKNLTVGKGKGFRSNGAETSTNGGYKGVDAKTVTGQIIGTN